MKTSNAGIKINLTHEERKRIWDMVALIEGLQDQCAIYLGDDNNVCINSAKKVIHLTNLTNDLRRLLQGDLYFLSKN